MNLHQQAPRNKRITAPLKMPQESRVQEEISNNSHPGEFNSQKLQLIQGK